MFKRIGLCLSLLLVLNVWAQDAWYRGNLHMHTYWSDGIAFPEEAVEYYRSRGYHFLCVSDHNLLQLAADNWQEVGGKKVKPGAAEQYLKTYGETADKKTEGGKDFVRLKTVGELKRQFDKAGEFLLIPGHEMNKNISGIETHMNAINVTGTLPFARAETPREALEANERAVSTHGRTNGCETLFMLNHPFWPYFDIQPDTLVALPQIRFYELSNDGNRHKAHPDWYTLEKFWDIANAFRITDGHPPVFGTATDDTHNYNPSAGTTLRGWVCVRADKLDGDTLVRAMNRGDFYSSSGVALKDIRFDEAAGTLSVEVDPKADETYTITFTVTRADFDRTTVPFDDPADDKKPARKGIKYSDTIGVVAKTVEGTSASYTLQPDDLYARATVTSATKMIKPMLCGPWVQTAWTQPYGWQSWQKRNPQK
ncbi:MAG: hypothetical protein FWH21_01715 [Kiritimatiellaeota bacterium]|nr:hypothetical protein [Kiritimatiellota bacterium]